MKADVGSLNSPEYWKKIWSTIIIIFFQKTMSFQVDKSVTFGNLSPMNDSRLKELHDSLKPKGPLPKDHRRHRHGQHPHTWSEGRNKRSFPTNTNHAKLEIATMVKSGR